MDLDLDNLGELALHADSLITIDLAVSRDATVVRATGLIETDGDGVELYEWTAASKLDPADKFDYEIAVKLATGRALEKAGRQLIRQANGRVKNIDDNRKQSTEQKTAREAAKKKELAAEVKAKLKSSTVGA